MTKISTTLIGSRSIDLHAFTGEVVDQSTSHHTEATVHANNQVTTSTTSYSQLFIRDKNGEEREINVPNMKIGVRRGTTASLIWGIKTGKDWGPYIAVYNHDTKSIHHIRKGNNDLAGPPGYNMMLIAAVIVGVIGGYGVLTGDFSSIVFLGAGCGAIYWIYMRQKKLMAAVDQAARAIIPA
jgi:hypothetical protein